MEQQQDAFMNLPVYPMASEMPHDTQSPSDHGHHDAHAHASHDTHGAHGTHAAHDSHAHDARGHGAHAKTVPHNLVHFGPLAHDDHHGHGHHHHDGPDPEALRAQTVAEFEEILAKMAAPFWKLVRVFVR